MSKSAQLLPTRLRQRMEVLGIDQAELARRCKQKPQAVSRWVHGHTTPGLDALDDLAGALETSASDLLKSEHSREPVGLPASLLELLHRCTPTQIRLVQGMLEQMVLEQAKDAGRAELATSTKERKRSPDKRGK